MRLVGFFFDHSSSRLGESIRSAAPTWPRAATTSSSAETAPVPSVRRAATVRFFFRGPSLGSRPHLEITPTPHLVCVCVCVCARVCVCVWTWFSQTKRRRVFLPSFLFPVSFCFTEPNFRRCAGRTRSGGGSQRSVLFPSTGAE